MIKASKRYVITTSAVNCYRYRVLSTGVDFSQYFKNPLLLWMHIRSSAENRMLPIGRAVDIRLEGDKWTCGLEFDENDPFAMSIMNKYEAGILNMLSLGATPVEISLDAALRLPGQDGPTVIRCKVTDVSCVDIGGNDEALVQLFAENGAEIALSRGNLSNLIAMAVSNELPAADETNHTHTTLCVLQNAVAAGKITEKEKMALMAIGDDDKSVKEIMAKVKAAKIDPQRLEGKMPKVLMPLLAKSWGEIDMAFGNGIRNLKEFAPEVYKAKFFEKNDRLPAERDGKPL